MDIQLRDEAAQDRVRAATEFLDPGKSCDRCDQQDLINMPFFLQAMHGHAGSSIRLLAAAMTLTT